MTRFCFEFAFCKTGHGFFERLMLMQDSINLGANRHVHTLRFGDAQHGAAGADTLDYLTYRAGGLSALVAGCDQ